MKRVLGVLFLAAVGFALSSAAAAQVVYRAGRCDGSRAMIAGEAVFFFPDDSPLPEYLWIAVLAGQGSVIMAGSGGYVSEGFYFSSGDVLLFPVRDEYELNYQGDAIQIAYGGGQLGSTPAPVCGTGLFGPVLILADQRYDVNAQSSTPGVSVQVNSYGTLASLYSGNLPYLKATNPTQVTTYPVPTCSGAGCCDPTQKVFQVNKSGTAGFTVYRMTSAPAANLDYAVVAPAPLSASATAAPTSGAAPLAVSFTGSASGGAPPYTWDWDFGDGSAHKSSQNVAHTYASAGVFHPVLTVRDSAAHTATDTHLVIDSTQMTATATATPASGNAPLNVAFKAAVAGGQPPYTYAWDFGDGAVSTAQNPSHTYASAGTYRPLLTVRDAAQATAEDGSLSIRVSPPGVLTADARADRTTGPLPLTVAFTGTVSGGIPPYTYAWSFGDGGQAATQNASHTYPTEGAYPVAFTVRDSASAAATDDHLTIYVGSDFQASATGQPLSGAAPLTVQFGAAASGGSPPYAYAWDFGDGSTSTLQNPSHTYGADGEYGVLLTAQDSIGRTATDPDLAVKVGSSPGAPVITGVAKATNPLRLKVSGEGFLVGCTVFISGQGAPSTAYKSGGLVVAKGGSSLKALLPKGSPVCVTVKNPSGLESACWTFVR